MPVAGNSPATNAPVPSSADLFAGLMQELGAAIIPVRAATARPASTPQSPSPAEATEPTAEPAAESPAAESPASGAPAIPVTDSRTGRIRQIPPTAPQMKMPVKSGIMPQIPFVPIPVMLPLPVAVRPNKFPNGPVPESPDRGARKAAPADNTPAPEVIDLDDTALEIRIRTRSEAEAAVKPEAQGAAPRATASAPPIVAAQAMRAPTESAHTAPEPARQSAPVPPTAIPVMPSVTAATAVHAVTAPVAARTPEVQTSKAPQPPARGAYVEEPVERPSTASQPVRSLSLEFTPDGVGDVRLRLSERTGEVHISLHSSDTTLGSRLHEGVHDLIGSLSSAGYEAEAWTPGQGQQQNRREPERREHGRSASAESGDGNFADLFQQPVQEVS